jgi:hypothetical protein
MRARDLTILLVALGLGIGCGVVILATDTLAVELPPMAPASATAATALEAPPEAPPPSVAPPDEVLVPVSVDFSPSPRDHVDTGGWSKGVVRGDVRLTASVLDRIQTLSVIVEEMRNPIGDDGTFQPPHKQIVPVEIGRGTPTFEVRDVPFSEYPYLVCLHSPGLNGGRSTITIDAKTPLQDVVLTLMPGSPFSLLLRDQDGMPHAGLTVRMQPTGEPHGRKGYHGRSDSGGGVLFEDVLSGDYQVTVSQGTQPIGEARLVHVEAGARMFRDKVQGQGQVVTIPRGVAMVVQVTDARGYGLADAHIRMQASDRVKLTVVEATTDSSGRAEFPYLVAGTWQMDVEKQDFQRRTRQVSIRPDVPPDPQQVQLVRIR